MRTCSYAGSALGFLLLISYGCTGERASGEGGPKDPTSSTSGTSDTSSSSSNQGTTGSGQSSATSGGSGGSSTTESATSTGGESSTANVNSTITATTSPNPAVNCSFSEGDTGIWKEISPPEFLNPSNMESMAIVVNPQDGTVYAAAGNVTNGGDQGTGVYRSSDCGQSFELISTGPGAQNLFTGNPWAMRINPDKPHILYINNGYGNDPTIYRSRDGGFDFTALHPAPADVVRNYSQAIAIDPDDPDHLIMSWHLTCEGGHTPMCLVRTKDSGDTWEIVEGPPSLPGWQEAASVSILGPDSYVYTGPGVWFTSDAGKNWTQVMDFSIFGSYGGGAHKASDGRYYLPGGRGGGGVGQVNIAEGSPLGSSWQQLKAPPASVIIDDGEHLITSYAYLEEDVFNWAPLDDPENWSPMPDEGAERGTNMMAYDPVNRIAYSANWGAGLWRFVSPR